MKRNCPLLLDRLCEGCATYPQRCVFSIRLSTQSNDIGQLTSEEHGDAVANAGDRGQVVNELASRPERHVNRRVREGDPGKDVLDVAASVASDFRNARRTGVLKNRLRTSITVPDRPARWFHGPATPPSIVISAPSLRVGLTGLAAHLRHLGDRRERLAAKSERGDPVQVVGSRQLARRVGSERERQVVGSDPRTVVRDPDEILAAAFDRHIDARCAPASIAFSISSFTTLAGRSTTSPAAI